MIDARLLVVDNDAYRFRHPLLGEVVYADLLPPRRTAAPPQDRRGAAAATRRRLRRADRAGELAFHLDRAGDIEGAFVGPARGGRCSGDGRAGCCVRTPRACVRAVGFGRPSRRARQPRRPLVAGGGSRYVHGRQPTRARAGPGCVRVRAPSARRAHSVTSGSADTCGRPDSFDESRVEFDLAAGLLSGDEGVEAALCSRASGKRS